MSGLCCEEGFFNLGLLFSVFSSSCVYALPSTKGGAVTGSGTAAGAISTVAVPVEGERKELWFSRDFTAINCIRR